MARTDRPHVVMFSAEVYPYIKVGGLGDVLGALPKVLDTMGARVTVVLPAYKAIQHDLYGIVPYTRVNGFQVPMGPGFARAEVFHTWMPGSEVEVLFLGCPQYFFRDGVYDDPISREGFFDNMERFVFFMKAGIELLSRIGEPVDVIHCHDSQTALIPGMLRTSFQFDPFFAASGTLMTIHNMAYQGLYPRETLYWAGIDHRYFYPTSPFEFWGRVNFMKVGIEYSDLINTVSRTYATEIQSSPEFGYGLEGVLRRRKDNLSGIVNGIDYHVWDPSSDPLLPDHFSADDLTGKSVCKREVLRAFCLPDPGRRVPLIGIISRLADQKGFDLIEAGIDELAAFDLQLVVLGTGQHRYHDLLRRIQARHPDKVGVRLAFDNRLSHVIEAGCDMFLMPSKYEPCGLNQLYSLRYGTVPIVRATGGLADTVIDYDAERHHGTGFSFKNYSAREMLVAIQRALVVYSNTALWEDLVRRDMSQDWSWEESARNYMLLYRKICERRHSPATSVPSRP
jgi:starch synthase